jgi:hypothetical protein
MMALLAGTTVAGCVVTYRQMTSGEMSPNQFKRYQSFLGLSGGAVYKLHNPVETHSLKPPGDPTLRSL